MTPVPMTCPYCGETRTGVHPATRTAVAELLSAGVVPIGRN
jgi:hypothetical protein